MKIAVVGPPDLTLFDKQEIESNLLDFLEKGHDILLLAYRSIENEVFKFFVERLDESAQITLASRLHIVTFQPFNALPQRLQVPIQFLSEHGASYQSFGITDLLIRESVYKEKWTQLVQEADIVVGFNDGEEQNLKKIFIPLDLAKEAGKKALVYPLPRDDEEKFLSEARIRIIQ